MQFFKWSENEKKRRRGTDNICWKYIRSIEVYYNLDQKFWFWIIFNSYISVIFIYIMSIKNKDYKITNDKVRWRLFQQVFRDRKKIILFFKKKKNLVTFPPINLWLLEESSFMSDLSNSNYKLMQFFKWSENEKKRRRSIDNIWKYIYSIGILLLISW